MTHDTYFTADWFTSYAAEDPGSECDLDWLRLLGHLRDIPAFALEIGSHEGRSACWLLDNLLTYPSSYLYCVDPWDGSDPDLGHLAAEAERRFDANVAYYGQRVTKFKMTSLRFLSLVVNVNVAVRYDLIFIDGSHEGYDALSDLVLAWPLLSPGGWLALDDYLWGSDKLRACPKAAFDAWVSVRPPSLAEVVPVGRMMFARKEGQTP